MTGKRKQGDGRRREGGKACFHFMCSSSHSSYDLDTASIPGDVKPLLAMKMLDKLVDTSGYGACDRHVTVT